MSVSATFIFTALSSDVPASSKIACMFVMTCRTCATRLPLSIVAAIRSAPRKGVTPVTKTKPPALTAWFTPERIGVTRGEVMICLSIEDPTLCCAACPGPPGLAMRQSCGRPRAAMSRPSRSFSDRMRSVEPRRRQHQRRGTERQLLGEGRVARRRVEGLRRACDDRRRRAAREEEARPGVEHMRVRRCLAEGGHVGEFGAARRAAERERPQPPRLHVRHGDRGGIHCHLHAVRQQVGIRRGTGTIGHVLHGEAEGAADRLDVQVRHRGVAGRTVEDRVAPPAAPSHRRPARPACAPARVALTAR